MKAGPKTYLFLGIVGFFVFWLNLAELLSGQGDLIDILEAIFSNKCRLASEFEKQSRRI